MQLQHHLKILLIISIIAASLVPALFVSAAPEEGIEPTTEITETENQNEYSETQLFSIYLDEATISKGYTIDLKEEFFKLAIFPAVFNQGAEIEIKEITGLPLPINKKLVSKIFQYDIKNLAAYDKTKPIILQLNYEAESPNFRKLYFWDDNHQSWRLLPTSHNPRDKFLRAKIYLPFAKVAIFEDYDLMEQGSASWYRYKGCACAASPDFPKGAEVRVTNLDNDKSVVVKINDFGPDRQKHPDRVIDLDSTAFKEIASLRQGLVSVKVEPLEYDKRAITITNSPDDLVAKTRSAIVVNEATGEILWSKNPSEILPIASLTKLMTFHIFQGRPVSWDQEIVYSKNYDREGARLYVKDGEIMTIKDLFYSAVLGSANNAIIALVANSGLTQEEFAEQMNEQARDWGLNDTHFVEPTGLDPNNHSSAKDLARLSQIVFQNPELLEIAAQTSYSFQTVNTQKNHYIKNTNTLLNTEADVLAGKTGYSEEAGYCLVLKATGKAKGQLLVIVLNSPDSSTRFAEAQNLLYWGLQQM